MASAAFATSRRPASYAVDRSRWAQLDICEQMANVGAEVGRAIAATRSGRLRRADAAIDRALDLFDATVDTQARAGAWPRVREVLRAREEFANLFFGDAFGRDADAVERYFTQFAYAARAMRDAPAADIVSR